MTFDVAARVADAHGAVENTQTFVSACAAVGYQHPDLTTHGAQIIQWFECDDGLDLAILGADCDRLQAALAIAEDTMRLEDAAAEGLNAAWVGAAGSDAADFVARHRRTVGGLVQLIRSAADGCSSLRDTLWRIVDTKVAVAITIDDRRLGERSAWLAAARTVMTGGQDRSAAAEIVAKAVVPYVDSDIRIDWVDAMRSARASAAGAYGESLNRLTRSAAIDFEVPIRLLPLPRGRGVAVGVPPVGVPPVGETASQSSPQSERVRVLPPLPHSGVATATAPEPSMASPPGTPPQAMEAPLAAPPPGGLPSGLSALPSLDGLASGRSDPSPISLPGLGETDPVDRAADDGDSPDHGSAEESDDQRNKEEHDGDDADPDDADPDDADPDDADPDDADADDADADDTAPDGEANVKDDGDTGPNDAGDSGSGGGSSVPQVNPPLPAQEQAPPPTDELAADPIRESEGVPTPCEIAADELPQVGE